MIVGSLSCDSTTIADLPLSNSIGFQPDRMVKRHDPSASEPTKAKCVAVFRRRFAHSRVAKSFEAVHRKSQDHVYSRLHRQVETGELDGFGMVYLGQQDHRLPYRPIDLVGRDEVRNYPTDFASISAKDLDLLTKRGEQLAHIILDRYLPHL
jgi:hypothetical protein